MLNYACAEQGHAAFDVLVQYPQVRNVGSRHCLHAGFISRDGGCFPGQPREHTTEQKKTGL